MSSSGLIRAGAAITVLVATLHAPGATLVVQEGFAPRFEMDGAEVWEAVATADGSFLVAGDFASIDGASRPRLARFLASGALDTTFQPAAIQNGIVRGMALDASGRLVLVGTFTRVGGVNRAGIVRLTITGAVDPTFDPGSGFGPSPGVYRVAIDSAGRIVVAGGMSTYNGTNRRFVVRLLADGSLDPAFVPGLAITDMSSTYSLALQADDKVLVGGSGSTFSGGRGLWRLNTDGTVDTAFNAAGTGTSGSVWRIAVQPADGKILIAGTMTSYNATAVSRLARLNADGTLDTAFTPAVTGTLIYGLGLGTDGRITVAGDFSSAGGTTRRSIARILPDGTIDAGFNPAANNGFTGPSVAYALAALPMPDGSAIIGGSFTAYNGAARAALLRCAPDGALDASFTPALRVPGVVHAVRELAGGTLLVGGQFGWVNGVRQPGLARLLADGTLDPGFAAPSGTGFAVSGFPYTPAVRSLAVQDDGRILAAGTFHTYDGTARNGIVRLEADGTLDATFDPGTGASGPSTNLVRRVGSDVFVGGNITFYNGTARSDVARLDANGGLSAGFDPGTGFATIVVPNISELHGLEPLDNGSILVAGEFSLYRGATVGHVLALDATAAPDAGFAAGAGFGGVARPRVFALTRSGARFFAGGEFTTYAGATAVRLVALTSGGAIDPAFATGAGFDGPVSAILPRPDGTVLVGGDFFTYDGTARRTLALLTADGGVSGDLEPGALEPIMSSAGAPTPVSVRTLAQTQGGALLVGGAWLQAENFTGRGLLKFAGAVVEPPTIVASPASANVLAGAGVAFAVDASGPGPLAYRWQRQPAGGASWEDITDTPPYSGATTATLNVTPVAYPMNGDQFRCIVSNGNPPDATSAPATLTVRVPPVITPIPDATIDEQTALAFTVVATDPGTPAQALTYALGGAPAGATINATTGAFTWTPFESQGPGVHTIAVIVTKTDGASAQESFTVTVREANAAPVLAAIGNRYVNRAGPLAFIATATDSDQPTQALTFSLDAGAPPWASIDGVSGAFSAAPGDTVADGSHPVIVRVTDDAAIPLTDSEAITITIDRTAPRISAMAPAGVTNSPIDRVTLTFTDAILFSTFTAGDVTVFGPGGAVPVLGVDRVNDTIARVRFVSSAAPGTYTLTVLPTLADAAGNALDQDGDDTPGEATDDRFVASFSLLAPPDLVVENVTISGDGLPGQPASASWTLRNTGDSALPSSGFTGVALSHGGSTTSLHHLVDDTFPGGIPAGAALPRSKDFVMPSDGPTGVVHVVVTANRDRSLTEANYANNAALSANAFTVPAQLTLSLPVAEVREDAGSAALVGTVSRNGPAATPLTVALASNDATEATVPASVVIPTGQAAVTFAIAAVADDTLDGVQTARLSASSAGYATGVADLRVLDVDTESLAATIADPVLLEGEVRTVTLARTGATTAALVVQLRSSSTADLAVPASVTIPAGAASVDVSVTAVPDDALEVDREVTLTSETSGYASASLALTIIDDDPPGLGLTLSTDVVGEGAGPAALHGTVTRSPVLATALTLTVTRSDPSAVIAPAQVTIPGGLPAASFALGPVDNSAADGDRTVRIGVAAVVGGVTVAAAPDATLTILDDDGPRLTLDISDDVVGEGLDPATTATVSRPTAGGDELVVTLTSSDPATATAPASITIPAGSTAVTFPIVTPAQPDESGSRTVVFTTTAAGLNPSEDALIVTDEARPELLLSALEVPDSGPTDAFVNVVFRVSNDGFAAAQPPPGRPWTDRVYLSMSGTMADATFAGEVTFGDSLAPGASYERTLPVRLPAVLGNYFIIVVANADARVEEITRGNNSRTSATPIAVKAAYSATVSADITTGTTGQPVTFTGRAMLTGNGLPAASVLVHLHLGVRGTRRLLSVVTDANGDFLLRWTPLTGEGGRYTIGAGHPGVANVPVQDEFNLLGIAAAPAPLVLDLPELSTVARTFEITNLADVPLTNCSFTVIGAPAGVTATATLATSTLGALASTTVNVSVAAGAGSAGASAFALRFTSAEGASHDVVVDCSVVGPTPVLVADVAGIEATMLVGAQRIVPVTLSNIGGAATGAIAVHLPAASWLSAGTVLPLPSLAAGASTTLDLVLTPPADLELAPYSGAMLVEDATTGASLRLPLTFRAVSDATGTLVVEVTDEFTFYTSAAPRVDGAAVTLLDPFDGTVIAEATTGPDGAATFAALPAGNYQIEARADRHGAARTTAFVEPGATTTRSLYIPYEAVRYAWSVEPTEIADHYRVTVETTFETNVPKPVVVVDPAVIELGDLVLPGQEKQVDLTFTNHGLITANRLQLRLPSVPGYEFAALATGVDAIAARQSVTIPVVVRRLDPVAAAGLAPGIAAAGGDPCAKGGYGFFFPCAGADQPGGGTIETSGGPPCRQYSGGPGGDGELRLDSAQGGEAKEDLPCDVCLEKLGQSALKCALNLGAGAATTLLPPTAAACFIGNVSLGCAIEFGVSGTTSSGAFGCLFSGGLSCAPVIGPVVSAVDCACSLLSACDKDSKTGDFCGIGNSTADAVEYLIDVWHHPLDQVQAAGHATDDRARVAGVDPVAATAPIADTERRLRHLVTYPFYILGDMRWLQSAEPELVSDLLEDIAIAADDTSDAGAVISPAEADALRARPRPADLPGEVVDHFIARWNRSQNYWALGIVDHDDVPAGQDADFIALDFVRKFAALLDRDLENAQVRVPGQSPVITLLEEHAAAIQLLVELLTQPRYASASAAHIADQLKPAATPIAIDEPRGVCATVRLRLEQGVVMTRSGFKASLELANGLGDVALSGVSVELVILDERGLAAGDRFAVRAPTLDGLTAIDGTGVVAPATTGTVEWILVPNDTAAPQVETPYFVSGRLRYQQDDQELDIILAPVEITVLPDAALALRYFHQRDVFSDDPHTLVLEPAEPFTLAVLMTNQGAGIGRDLAITTGQPQIVENEKGLLNAFQVVGGEVFEGPPGALTSRALPPSLTVDLGDLLPGETKLARWALTSTLQGLFTDYDATFEHHDGLGDPRLSLIKSVEIHELVRAIDDATGAPAFLVNDLPDARDLPDVLYFADGTTTPVSVVESATPDGGPTTADLVVQLVATMPAGWTYLRAPDPADGAFRLVRVQRGDGSDLATGRNAWVTDRTFIGLGRRPVRENLLHLVDADSAGTYTLTYALPGATDTTAPSSAVTALPAASVTPFLVTWSGSDDTAVASYDVYVSEDGGAETLWRSATTATGAIFAGGVGRTYAFHTRARDAAGNLEDAPPAADAVTVVTASNSAPTLTPVPDQVIDEGGTLAVTLTATDPDTGTVLTFRLGAGAPPGVSLSGTTGELLWATSTALGGATYSIPVEVLDNGTPRLSDAATLVVTVRDVNQPPVLAPIAPVSQPAGRPLALEVTATDSDLPAQALTFHLAGSAPEGMSIDPGTGLITWTPGTTEIGSVREITVGVTDDGVPALGATTTLVVTVQANPDLARDTWASSYFTPEEILDLSISGDAADPNQNARSNLVDYALGAPGTGAFDPATYLRSEVAVDPVGGGHFARLVFRQRKDDPRLIYAPEVSADRVTWQGGDAAIEETGRVAVDDTFDEVTVQDRAAVAPGAPRYFRLRVVRN